MITSSLIFGNIEKNIYDIFLYVLCFSIKKWKKAIVHYVLKSRDKFKYK